MAVQPIPEGYRTVTPYLVVPGVAKLIDFLTQVFDATEEGERMSRPDGGVMHTEVRLGDSRIMMGEPMGGSDVRPGSFYVYVSDTDATYQRALRAGATSVMEPADQFYGDRNAGVKDQSGNIWWMATHIEDVPPEETKRRAAARTTQTAHGG